MYWRCHSVPQDGTFQLFQLRRLFQTSVLCQKSDQPFIGQFWEPLSLEGFSQGTDAKEQEVYSHRRVHLLDLRLMTSGYSQFVDWLLGSQSPLDISRVQTLHINYIYPSEVHIINHLLPIIGDSLKHFKLNLPKRPWSESSKFI
jgi:hypothetical protein